MLIEDEIKKAKSFFNTNTYLSELFDASIDTFKASNNKLNLNNFACNARELFREKFRLEAPDEEVKKMPWFNKSYMDDKGEPTRKARLRYYIFNQLQDVKYDLFFEENISNIEDKYVKIISKLSKYTHITEAVFYTSQDEKDELFSEVIKIIIEIIDYINTAKVIVYEDFIKILLQDAEHYYFDEIKAELFKLYPDMRLKGITKLEYKIKSIDSEYIHLECKMCYSEELLPSEGTFDIMGMIMNSLSIPPLDIEGEFSTYFSIAISTANINKRFIETDNGYKEIS